MPVWSSVHLKNSVSFPVAQKVDTAVIDADHCRRRLSYGAHIVIDLDRHTDPALMDVVHQPPRDPGYGANRLSTQDEDTEVPIVRDVFLKIPGAGPEVAGLRSRLRAAERVGRR